MADFCTPEQSRELAERIKLVRRDIGSLVFHFTRKPDADLVRITERHGGETIMPASAYAVLHKILSDAELRGTGDWSGGHPCICFTEAPIEEFASVFSLVQLAASQDERPRYEPYGIAVSKRWLYAQGGRPVIYDHPDRFGEYPDNLRYRLVPYDPERDIDFTWEREWRIAGSSLRLDPAQTLVIVPTASEAFDVVYDYADIQAEYDHDGDEWYPSGAYHRPRWLAVSLDLFGVKIPEYQPAEDPLRAHHLLPPTKLTQVRTLPVRLSHEFR